MKSLFQRLLKKPDGVRGSSASNSGVGASICTWRVAVVRRMSPSFQTSAECAKILKPLDARRIVLQGNMKISGIG